MVQLLPSGFVYGTDTIAFITLIPTSTNEQIKLESALQRSRLSDFFREEPVIIEIGYTADVSPRLEEELEELEEEEGEGEGGQARGETLPVGFEIERLISQKR